MAGPRHIRIGDFTVGNDLPLALIAGPCAIESRAHALETAEALVEMTRARDMPLIYKSSFDKANRTSASSARGIGMAKGLPILAEVGAAMGCKSRHFSAARPTFSSPPPPPARRSTSKRGSFWRRGT